MPGGKEVYQVDVSKCEGCGDCVEVCPSSAITLADKKAVINQDDCAECGSCEAECPNQAISEA
jgi:ferredoxin